MIEQKSERELVYIRDAGRIVAETHRELKKACRAGVTTKELDRIAEEYIVAKGAVPTCKGYHGYPATICASVNEEVVHGIPGARVLRNGDIIAIDITAGFNGYLADSCNTLPVGEISSEAQRLLKVTEESLYKGIEQAVIGNRLSDISNAVQTHVESNGFSVVRDFCGHGIGREMHEEPAIPNYGRPGHGPRLKRGMCLCIEPMVNEGTFEVSVLEDDWTAVTDDGKLSAHFEHTVAVTDAGPLILTEL